MPERLCYCFPLGVCEHGYMGFLEPELYTLTTVADVRRLERSLEHYSRRNLACGTCEFSIDDEELGPNRLDGLLPC